MKNETTNNKWNWYLSAQNNENKQFSEIVNWQTICSISGSIPNSMNSMLVVLGAIFCSLIVATFEFRVAVGRFSSVAVPAKYTNGRQLLWQI